jgi:hypothetical protein
MLLYLFLIFLQPKIGNTEKFCYEGEVCGPQSDLWPGECKTGFNQSPIDLKIESLPKKGTLRFNEGYKSNGNLVNLKFLQIFYKLYFFRFLDPK